MFIGLNHKRILIKWQKGTSIFECGKESGAADTIWFLVLGKLRILFYSFNPKKADKLVNESWAKKQSIKTQNKKPSLRLIK